MLWGAKKKKNPTATPQPNNCSHLISILPGFKTENQFIFLEKGTLIEDYVRHSYFRFTLLGGSKLAFLIEILTDSLKLDVSKLQVTSLHCACKFANLFLSHVASSPMKYRLTFSTLLAIFQFDWMSGRTLLVVLEMGALCPSKMWDKASFSLFLNVTVTFWTR